jgi:hypothetical protein
MSTSIIANVILNVIKHVFLLKDYDIGVNESLTYISLISSIIENYKDYYEKYNAYLIILVKNVFKNLDKFLPNFTKNITGNFAVFICFIVFLYKIYKFFYNKQKNIYFYEKIFKEKDTDVFNFMMMTYPEMYLSKCSIEHGSPYENDYMDSTIYIVEGEKLYFNDTIHNVKGYLTSSIDEIERYNSKNTDKVIKSYNKYILQPCTIKMGHLFS